MPTLPLQQLLHEVNDEGGERRSCPSEGGDGAQTRSLLSPAGLQQVACLQQLGLGLAHAHWRFGVWYQAQALVVLAHGPFSLGGTQSHP